MVSKESLVKTLEECAAQASDILNSIIGNDSGAKIDDLYNKLKESKHTLYGDSLFRHTSSLLSQLKRDEEVSEEEKVQIEQIVIQIDLALFAYNIFRDKEYKTCANSFFQRAVSPFNKYTKNEIQLFLCLRLYLLRQKMNANENANKTDLINEHFSKEPETYFFADDSSEKEAGRRQIMMVVDMVSELLCSKLSDLEIKVRFGSLLMVNKFLKEFIQYRLGGGYSCEPERESEKGIPETKDELKALVDEIFDEDFIDEINDQAIKNDDSAETYTIEEDSEEDGDSSSGSSCSESDSDKDSSSSSSNKKSNTDFFANLPVNEDGEEDELPDKEEEEEEGTTESTSKSIANASRHRITDEQPGARPVTAQEADFSDDASIGSSKRSSDASTSNNEASGSRRRRQPSRLTAQNPRKRRALANRGRRSSVPDDNAYNTSVNGEQAEEQEQEQATPPPPKFHICDDGRSRPFRPIPKIREKAQRWTEEEVQALEEGLRFYKRNAWSNIHQMFKDVLGSHKPTQLKDKAKNEVKRRQKKGIPLGGFQFFLNPQE